MDPFAHAAAECPDESALLDLVSARLPQDAALAVHAHVAGCAACEVMVAELLRHDEGPAVHRGATVGRFVVLDELGSGGMGSVFSAFDPQLDRKVALKLLHSEPGGTKAQLRARMLGEARALARLSHPNVVTVYDANELSGRVWLALELVDGASLRTFLREAPRRRRQVLGCLVAAGRGLAAAHAHGVLHRDVKPDNILVARDGQVRITDFGLSALPEGQRAGTPGYLSPEQWRGGPADARSDQFAFCVTAWEALTGERPFAGEGDGFCAAVRRGPPPARLPSRLRRLLVRGLAEDPAERHFDLSVLVEALARDRMPRLALGLLGVVVAAALLVAGAAAERRGSRALCSGAAARLAGVWDAERKANVKAALLGSAAPGAQAAWAGVERAVDAWSQSWRSAHVDACEATRRGEQSERILDLRMGCLARRARDLSALLDLLGEQGRPLVTEHAVQAAFLVPPVRECAVVDQLTALQPPPRDPTARAVISQVDTQLSEVRALSSAGRLREALARAQPAADFARKSGHPPTIAEALYELGSVQTKVGAAREAQESLQAAAWAAEEGHHDRVAARARVDLVYVVAELHARFQELPQLAGEAQAAIARLGGDPDLEAQLETLHAGALTLQDRCEEAMPHLTHALELAGRAWDAQDPRRGRVLNNLGNALRCVGDLSGALRHHREALALRERALGSWHPDVASSLNNVGTVFFTREQFAEALPYFQRALAIRERALSRTSPILAASMLNVGVGLIALEREAEGRDAVVRALEIEEATLGPDSPALAHALSILGHVEVDLGRPEAARLALERALSLLGARDDMQVALARFNLARALRSEGREPVRAGKLAAQARRWFEKRRGSHAMQLREIDEWLRTLPPPGPPRAGSGTGSAPL